jgi:hypothetical protein
MKNLFGAIGTITSDQNPNRAAQLRIVSEDGLSLGIEALE